MKQKQMIDDKPLEIGGLYEFTNKPGWVFGPYLCIEETYFRYIMLDVKTLEIEKWHKKDIYRLVKIEKLSQ